MAVKMERESITVFLLHNANIESTSSPLPVTYNTYKLFTVHIHTDWLNSRLSCSYLHLGDQCLVDDGARLYVAVVRGRDLVDHLAVLLREYHVLVRQVWMQPVLARRRLVVDQHAVVVGGRTTGTGLAEEVTRAGQRHHTHVRRVALTRRHVPLGAWRHVGQHRAAGRLTVIRRL